MENIKNLDNWKLFIDGALVIRLDKDEIGEFIFMLDDYIEKRWRHTPMAENGILIQSTQWCIEKGQKIWNCVKDKNLDNVYVQVIYGDVGFTNSCIICDGRKQRLMSWGSFKDSLTYIGDEPFGIFNRKRNAASYVCRGSDYNIQTDPGYYDCNRGLVFDDVQSANKYCLNSKVVSTLLYFKEKHEDYEKCCTYVSGPYQVAKISKNGLEYFASFNSSVIWHFIKWADENCYTVNSIFDVYFNDADACDNAVRYLNKGEKPPVNYRGL